MNRQLAAAISSILAISAYSSVAGAQQVATPDPAAAPAQLEPVIVTGSWIPQIQQENASPVVAITAEDIDRQGFQNVSELLRAQPLATGAVQDNQFSGGFTPGATTISLLGLEPGFTLILLDGRPLADYPLLYNGEGNFTDLSSIPTGMVERIDVLPGNQSAIYGSAAIAGVVNIILKKRIEGVQLAARAGGYEQGGGDNMRFELTGGMGRDNLDVTFGFQYSSQEPICGTDRECVRFAERRSGPETLRFGSRTFLSTLTSSRPAPVRPFTSIRAKRPARDSPATSAARPSTISAPAAASTAAAARSRQHQLPQRGGKRQRLPQRQLAGSATTPRSTPACCYNRTRPTAASRFWTPDVNGTFGYIWDDDGCASSLLNLYQHIFSPEETGGRTGTRDQRLAVLQLRARHEGHLRRLRLGLRRLVRAFRSSRSTTGRCGR